MLLGDSTFTATGGSVKSVMPVDSNLARSAKIQHMAFETCTAFQRICPTPILVRIQSLGEMRHRNTVYNSKLLETTQKPTGRVPAQYISQYTHLQEYHAAL